MTNIDRPWLAHYPPDVPADIDVTTHSSLVALLDESFLKYRDRPAFSNAGTVLTYGEVESLSTAFAGFLAGELALKKGDRFAIMLPNLLQYPVALFGALRAGLTVVNTNPLYTTRELRNQLADSGAKALLVLDSACASAQEALAGTEVDTIITTAPSDLLTPLEAMSRRRSADTVRFLDALIAGRRHHVPEVDIAQGDIAFLQYTGGTTGIAKGAMLTHRNMLANTLQTRVWIAGDPARGPETVVTALPLYHIFSLTVNCLVYTSVGGRNHLITNPRDMNAFVNELQTIPFTTMTGVSTLFNGLLNTPGFDQIDFSRLHLAMAGGMALQRPVADRWKAVTGKPIVEGYGLTETSPVAFINRLDITAHTGAIGYPISGTDARICDVDGQLLPLGETGELCIRGPQVMEGYWQQPAETANVLDGDGWLRTGDIARMDAAGQVFIVDRKKDMILVSGFNVYPNEIEDIVMRHPGVAEVAAVGIDDEHSGEAVKLYVVRKVETLTAEVLIAHCRDNLTAYKCPKVIAFRDALPKTNVGKILRRILRDENAVPNTAG